MTNRTNPAPSHRRGRIAAALDVLKPESRSSTVADGAEFEPASCRTDISKDRVYRPINPIA